MRKVSAIIIAVLLLTVSLMPMTALAKGNPELMLAAYFNDEADTITVYYRVLNFLGTESADFRLRFNPDVVEYIENEKTKMSDVIMEIGVLPDKPDTLAIEFVDLYFADEDDCEEDGSATVVKFTFKVKDASATEAVFISTSDSYNITPDSQEITTERATLKVMLNEGSKGFSTVDGYVVPEERKSEENNGNITKIIVAAAVTAVVFVAGLVAVVIKYRKK